MGGSSSMSEKLFPEDVLGAAAPIIGSNDFGAWVSVSGSAVAADITGRGATEGGATGSSIMRAPEVDVTEETLCEPGPAAATAARACIGADGRVAGGAGCGGVHSSDRSDSGAFAAGAMNLEAVAVRAAGARGVLGTVAAFFISAA